MCEDILASKLKKICEEDRYPMHMPGHKRNLAPVSGLPYEWDVTEVPGTDDLHAADGVLKEAMERTAKLWGSRRIWYLVNGSTCGLLAAIYACVPAGGEVIIARNCHKSVYHAVELLNLKVHWLMPPFVPEWEISGSIRPSDVTRLLREHPSVRTVVLTSPTYEGVLSDIASIARICHAAGARLIVDEAHGAHLGLLHRQDGAKQSGYPDSALHLGADIVIQSAHKTLPSLTQTALLHLGWGESCAEGDGRIEQAPDGRDIDRDMGYTSGEISQGRENMYRRNVSDRSPEAQTETGSGAAADEDSWKDADRSSKAQTETGFGAVTDEDSWKDADGSSEVQTETGSGAVADEGSGRDMDWSALARRIEHALDIFETSSPSYPLMASLDGCTGILAARGEELSAEWRRQIRQTESVITTLRNVRVLQRESGLPSEANSPKDHDIAASSAMSEMDDRPSGRSSNPTPRAVVENGTHLEEKFSLREAMDGRQNSPRDQRIAASSAMSEIEDAPSALSSHLIYAYDNTRFLLRASGDSGISGEELARLLREECGIESEMYCGHNVLLMSGCGDSPEGWDRFRGALCRLDRILADRGGNSRPQGRTLTDPALPMTTAEMFPAEAYRRVFAGEYRCEPLSAAAGRISAEYVMAYPPGIPILTPGERITLQTIHLIDYLTQSGSNMRFTLSHRAGDPEDGICCLYP